MTTFEMLLAHFGGIPMIPLEPFHQTTYRTFFDMKHATQAVEQKQSPELAKNASAISGHLKTVETFHDVENALSAAARTGTPCIADWPHRAIDFRILERLLGDLDHPVKTFSTVLPDDWSEVPGEIRDRIPGNARNNHMRLVATFKRAIGFYRPDLDPWSALQVFADVEMAKTSPSLGRVKARAKEGDLRPVEINNKWIEQQLTDLAQQNEAKIRGIFHFLVRLSKKPSVRAAGLLQDDLKLPLTNRQKRHSTELPEWLQTIYDEAVRPTQNALDRIWLTIERLNLTAKCPQDILSLIDKGKLSHSTVNQVEPIKINTWNIYVRKARKAL